VTTNGLSEADKYILLGRLLKKRRSEAYAKRALRIVNGSGDLDAKIAALNSLDRRDWMGPLPDGKSPGSTWKVGEQPEEADHSSPVARTVSSRRLKVLVVDPHPDIAGFLQNAPIERKCTYSRVATLEDALDVMKRQKPRIVILNPQLSLAEGLQMGETVLALVPGVGVIILVPKAQPSAPSVKRHPNIRLVYKPVNLFRYSEAVKELAENREAR
jgi:hypothetical protein